MKKIVLASLLAVTLGSFAAMAEELSGYISDSHCGAKHHEVSDANTKCVSRLPEKWRTGTGGWRQSNEV